MARQIRITAGDVSVTATLEDNPMADAFWAALPIDGRAQLWGDEIYFSTPVRAPANAGEGAETVELGAVAFWPPGNALCLFFGPTPMSANGEIRPASAVHVMGRIDGDPTVLKRAPSGKRVRVERV